MFDSEVRGWIRNRDLRKGPALIRAGYVPTGLRFISEMDPEMGVRECERTVATLKAKGAPQGRIDAINAILTFARGELAYRKSREGSPA